MKTVTTFLVMCATLLSAQNIILKPAGFSSGQQNEIIKIKTMVSSKRGFKKVIPYDNSLNGVTGIIDTMRYAAPNFNWGTNFGFFGQDVMVQWFEAPSDMDINAVSFMCSDDENSNVSVKIVAMNWDKDQIQATQGDFGASWWGYYEADQNGFNDISSFQDDPETTGGWVEKGEGETQQWGSPFGSDLWSDQSVGSPATAVLNEETWVNMNQLGFSPSVMAGDIFGVVIKNESTTLDEGRTGLMANNTIGFTGFKFYRNGRLQTGVDYGWWTRLYTWNISVAVDMSSSPPFRVTSFTILHTTLSTDPRQVNAWIVDDNPSGGPAGVAFANLVYTTDVDSTWTEVEMTGTEPDFVGVIPGQQPGTKVSYYIYAEDIQGYSASTSFISYKVFKPEQPTLLVMNGQGDGGYPIDYYFGHPLHYQYDHDVWAYGPLTDQLLDHYTNVIEIATGGPNVINNDTVRTWLEKNASHNYMLAGDEWLGAQTNWTDQDWGPGSFHYDILGITHEYNDIMDSANSPSQVLTVSGSLLGNTLDSLFNNVMADSPLVPVDTMWYDPNFEISVSNWLDGVDVTEDCDVFLRAVGADSNIYNIGHSRILPEGNKIAFFAYDPISLNSSPYYWFGWDQASPQAQVLKWFGVVTDIEDKAAKIVQEFNLSQNYPNPFNPSTFINYDLPIKSDVKLIIYDVLGRKVKTLVNKNQQVGNHKVTFNASGLASGVYYYKLQAGKEYTKSRKMLLLR